DTAPAGPAVIASDDDLSGTVAARQQQARALSARLAAEAAKAKPATRNENNSRPLVERLGGVSTLLETEQPYRGDYTALDGFDTHAAQSTTHRSLWEQTTDAVSSFLKRLDELKRGDEVVVFLFSEFGRRVKENGSLGTDHGAAAPVFVVGNRVKGGLQ